MSELLPCPFCGEKQMIDTVGRDWYRLDSARHKENCPLFMISLGEYPQTDEIREMIIDEWNTRTPSPGYVRVPVDAWQHALNAQTAIKCGDIGSAQSALKAMIEAAGEGK